MTKIRLQLNPWFDARPRFRLSGAEIQMAHELGLNLKKFGSFSTEGKQRWRLPLRVFIAECYFKHFKRELPELVRTGEVIDAEDALRKPSNGLGVRSPKRFVLGQNRGQGMQGLLGYASF